MKKGENVKMRKFATIFLIAIAIVSMSKPYGVMALFENGEEKIYVNGNQSKDELYWVRGLHTQINCQRGILFGTVNEPYYGTRLHKDTVNEFQHYSEVYAVPTEYPGCYVSLSANSWLGLKKFDKGYVKVFR